MKPRRVKFRRGLISASNCKVCKKKISSFYWYIQPNIPIGENLIAFAVCPGTRCLNIYKVGQ